MKKQSLERREADYYEKNNLDENPVIINATINLGKGRIVTVPVRKYDNVSLLAMNVCKYHKLDKQSSDYLVKILEDYKENVNVAGNKQKNVLL